MGVGARGSEVQDKGEEDEVTSPMKVENSKKTAEKAKKVLFGDDGAVVVAGDKEGEVDLEDARRENGGKLGAGVDAVLESPRAAEHSTMQDLHAAGRDVQENEKGEKEKVQEGLAKKKNTFKRVNRGGGGNKTEGNKKAAGVWRVLTWRSMGEEM